MTGPRVSDHALLRMLERSGLPVEAIRAELERSLDRAHRAARVLGARDYVILADGMAHVVRDGVVATVVPATKPHELARLLEARAQP